MAVTFYKRDEALKTGKPIKNAAQTVNTQNANTQAQAYTGLQGASQSTAQKVGQYQGGYQAGQSVQQAQQELQGVQAQKPQGYTSKYGEALEGILQQIQSPEKFKYSFNDDELFRYYADLYTQKGKQAAMDVQGQAAGLTGGYGNSYGAMAGNQAYQQYLLGLYDKGMDLRDRAYQQYQDRRADLYQQYGALGQQEQTEYGRHRDELGDWQKEREYWTGRYDTESERDYDRYKQELDYWTGLAQVEHADYRSEQERQEAIRQYEQEFAEKQRQYDQTFAEEKRQYDQTLAEQQRQYDQTFGEQQRQYDQELAERQRQYDQTFGEQQRQYDQEYAEGKRRYDQEYEEGKRRYDQEYAEQKRQYDQEFAEKQRQYDQTFGEQQRQYDQDFAEGQRQFDAQLAETRRQFDEEYGYKQMSEDKKYAYDYVMSILQGGQMPSLELLQAAGLSEADAQKIMSQYARTTGGGSGGYTPGTTKKPEVKTYGGLPYDKAKAAVEAGTAAARARAEEEYWQPKRAQHSAEGARLTGPEKAYQYKKTK